MTTQENIVLNAERRAIQGRKNRALRKTGMLPAVLYGKKVPSVSLMVNQHEFSQVLAKAGETSLIELSFNQKKLPVIIRQVQESAVKNRPLHVDFYAVDLKEKIEANIPLVFVGQAKAVAELSGTLIEVKSEVRVEALPANLVPEIEVDISGLNTFEDSLHVRDIQTPAGITILDDPEETIALVEPPRSEEELKELEAAPVSEEEAIAQVESETKEGTTEDSTEEKRGKAASDEE